MTINVAGYWCKKEDVPAILPDEHSKSRPIQDWGLCIEFKGTTSMQIEQERELIHDELQKYFRDRTDIEPKYHLSQADCFPGGYYLYAKNPYLLDDEDAVDNTWIYEVLYNIADALDARFSEGYSVNNLLVEDQIIFPEPNENIDPDSEIPQAELTQSTETKLPDQQEDDTSSESKRRL